MRRTPVARLPAIAAVGFLLACSPALNWREVRLDRLTAMLPCKPDHAQRTVPMAGRDVAMEMVGCEAAGALFAISHVHTDDAAHAAAVLQEWRTANLKNMQANDVAELATTNARGRKPAVLLNASGTGTNGGPLQARLAWWVDGADLFHMAVYAEHLTPDMTDAFFSEPKLQ